MIEYVFQQVHGFCLIMAISLHEKSRNRDFDVSLRHVTYVVDLKLRAPTVVDRIEV